jgi:hypothetical protein
MENLVFGTGIQSSQVLNLTLKIETRISSPALVHSVLGVCKHQALQPNLPSSTASVFARNENGIFGPTV